MHLTYQESVFNLKASLSPSLFCDALSEVHEVGLVQEAPYCLGVLSPVGAEVGNVARLLEHLSGEQDICEVIIIANSSCVHIPNQQHTLNKLPTELRCSEFVNQHRLSIQIGAKRAKTCMQCVYVYSNSDSILHTHCWWLGSSSRSNGYTKLTKLCHAAGIPNLDGDVPARGLPLLQHLLLHVLPGQVEVLPGVDEELRPRGDGGVGAEEVPGPQAVDVADVGGEALEATEVVRPDPPRRAKRAAVLRPLRALPSIPPISRRDFRSFSRATTTTKN